MTRYSCKYIFRYIFCQSSARRNTCMSRWSPVDLVGCRCIEPSNERYMEKLNITYSLTTLLYEIEYFELSGTLKTNTNSNRYQYTKSRPGKEGMLKLGSFSKKENFAIYHNIERHNFVFYHRYYIKRKHFILHFPPHDFQLALKILSNI